MGISRMARRMLARGGWIALVVLFTGDAGKAVYESRTSTISSLLDELADVPAGVPAVVSGNHRRRSRGLVLAAAEEAAGDNHTEESEREIGHLTINKISVSQCDEFESSVKFLKEWICKERNPKENGEYKL